MSTIGSGHSEANLQGLTELDVPRQWLSVGGFSSTLTPRTLRKIWGHLWMPQPQGSTASTLHVETERDMLTTL